MLTIPFYQNQLLHQLESRFEGQSDAERALDRFEREGREFFERVRGGYLNLAAAQSGRIRVIDASRALDIIKKDIEITVLSL